MSFTLKKIELKNIRCHEMCVFEPAEKGVTAISGPNGRGKSTIIDAVPWVLYGTKVNNAKTSSLIRDGVSTKTDSVYAKLTVEIGGIVYIIEKKIVTDSGNCECNIWGQNTKGEFELLAGPAVSHTQKFIRQLLQMDEKSFLTSTVIQQKQVDNIVSSSAKERGAVIEKMTGISYITNSVKKASEEHRSLQKAISILHKEDLSEIKNQIDASSSAAKEIQEKGKESLENFKNSSSELKEKEKLLSTETKKQELVNKTKNEMTVIKERIKWIDEQSVSDTEMISKYKKENKTLIVKKADEVNEKYEELLKEKLNNSNRLKDLSVKYVELSDKILELKEETDDFNLEDSKADLIRYEKEKEELVNISIPSLKESLTQFRLNIKQEETRKAHFVNGHNNNEHSCPLCKQEIKSVDEILKDLEENIEYNKRKEKEFSKIIKDKEEYINKVVDANIDDFKELISQFIELEEKEKSYNSIKDEMEEIRKQNDKISIQLNVLKKERDSLNEQKGEFLQVERAKERLLANSKERAKLLEKESKHQEKLDKLDYMTTRKYNALQASTENLRNRVHSLELKTNDYKNKFSLAKQEITALKDKYNRAKEQLDKYNQIAERIDLLAESQTLLSEFKKERIEQSIPTLEFYASDVLNKFTGGTFTKITLDNKFNAFVITENGTKRPISQLSGGELSASAIALRIGISLLLSANEKNMLILDEVLTSMDEERARNIMETISSVTDSQMIFVAHNTDINNIADKTVFI